MNYLSIFFMYRYLKTQVCHNIIKITNFWLLKDHSLTFYQWFSCRVYVKKLTVKIFLFYSQYSHSYVHIVIVLYCCLRWCIMYDIKVVLIVVHTLQFVRVLSSNYVQYSPLRYALHPLPRSVTHIFCVWSLVGITVVCLTFKRQTERKIVMNSQYINCKKYNNNYLLTYSMSRVLLEKLIGFQLANKFPAFYGTRRFIAEFTSPCHLSLFWVRSILSIPPSHFL